jgi:DNA primase small subunit
MDEATSNLLRKSYREYYFNNPKSIELPTNIEEREFGYIPFNGSMIRHLAFASSGELIAELVRQAPSSVYCSNARYSHPRLRMEEKGWLGADLIFDIDADSIPTLCKSRHNRWYCRNCRKEGRVPRPATCPYCHGADPVEVRWTCPDCLNATREHTHRLVDFLKRDFGESEKEIRTYFSGSRGYHVQVQDERFNPLTSQSRAEIANYIRGEGVLIPKSRTNSSARHEEYGWPERVRLFANALAPRNGRKSIRDSQRLPKVLQTNAATIDQSVTTDIHRVFRMPGTLHGNSGLLKMRVASLDDFDPTTDPVVLNDERVRVYIEYSPQFQLKGEQFGPYNSTLTDLPMYAAVFLLTKGLARVS